MFRFAEPRPRRRPSLTPMIDVVFLLLVFFMLASQFGRDAAVPLTLAAGGSDYTGPPRLVGITPTGVSLNGQPIALDALAGRLAGLTEAPDDILVLRPSGDVPLQSLIDVAETLRAAGFTQLTVVD